ncbi:MAG: hypothetical protein AAB864_02015 [Patescibacteria group bacterium]
MLAVLYGPLAGFPTPVHWVLGLIILPVAVLFFLKGMQLLEKEKATHEERVRGWGLVIAIFFGLLLPVALHGGGKVSVPSWLELVHTYRFALGVVLTWALRFSAYIIENNVTMIESNGV